MRRLLITLVLGLIPITALADSAPDATAPQESGNYDKTGKQLMPGEEIVTPTGKKMRVWNTAGPVPVQRAPEPFQKTPQEQGLPNGLGVIVDQRSPGVRNNFNQQAPGGSNPSTLPSPR